MIDQRGSGDFGAINCPKLQAQVGSSDIAVPSPDAVDECAGILGSTAKYYGIDQNTEDFDALRAALGVDKWVVDGVSYGTFTGARYAIGHPDRVRKLILDSVLPHHATADDSLALVELRGEAPVLRDACAVAPACGYDPAEDLAYVVRHRSVADGVRILDMIITYEFLDPTYRDPNPAGIPAGDGDVTGALHE